MNLYFRSMKRKKYIFSALILFSVSSLFAQIDSVQIKMFRDEPKGNIQYRKKGTLDGNLVRTVYQNNGEISDWFNGAVSGPHGEWPKGTGHRSLDGLSLLIGAKVKITNSLGKIQFITPIEAGYREEMDKDPVTGTLWGLEPVPGYVNPSATSPAIDADTSTYPETWPRSLFYDRYGTNETEIRKWDGYWYGYFGRGVRNAQLETFFVIDDSRDGEWSRIPYNFFPIKSDSTRGGLGLRVEVRGFQWTHVLAEDIIFWHYDIINMSDNDYDSTVFGIYTDPSVGSVDNNARFDSFLDMAYAWSPTGKGLPNNYKTGYYGQAFLESPGNSINGIDDDEDGIIDERRDDDIDNDGDWVPFTDLNGNGVWDSNEPLNDDVGTDGVGPYDLQYNGPDADGSQGNGIPDHGEPNFDETDKDESDQIGLQSAYIGYLSDKGPTGVWPKNDDVIWKTMTNGFKDTTINQTNISIIFASGIFPLKKAHRERFSVAILFGNDLEDLVFNKKTVQNIYNANYNFAQPPYTPTLHASAGDRKVYLYWNDLAERSYDRFLKSFDFEGYLLYRSTEPEFQDIKVITDAQGEPKFWKPLMQWDIIDSIKGPDSATINGASFWLGDDTGLEHSYIDTTVLNGVTYYYALVSYDRGLARVGLTHSECTKIISQDFNGTIKFVDINCAVITPSSQAAGYVPPSVNGNLKTVTQGIGSGTMSVTVVGPNMIKDGYLYRVKFDSAGTFPAYKTKSVSILRTKNSITDTLFSNLDIKDFLNNRASNPFDGITISIKNDTITKIIDSLTGWAAGSKTNAVFRAKVDSSNSSRNLAWPGDYEIKFFSTQQDTGALASGTYKKIPVNFIITNITSGYRVKFWIQDKDGSNTFSSGDVIRVLEYTSPTVYKICYEFTYVEPALGLVAPTDGDKFILRTSKQFAGGDFFEFSTRASYVENLLAKQQLDKISVVPNPYVATAKWEPRSLYQNGRGERKIDFTHLPKQCTIRIYTTAGALVKTLYKNSLADNGSASWDLISDDGMEVAYGLYVFHVDAPGIGEHIGKFAVIK